MPRTTTAALATLLILQTVMTLALFSGTEPHPPATVAPFAIAPFLSVSLAVAAAALILRDGGRALALLAAALALVSFGPQKYLDPAFPQIWPAVLTAQLAVAVIVAGALRRPA